MDAGLHMSVIRLRGIIWIVSILLTAGLGWYVYDIVVVFQRSVPLYEKAGVERVLMDVEDVKNSTRSLVKSQLIVKTFFDFDWSGKPAPVVVEAPEVEPLDVGPVYTPVEDILSVHYMEEDSTHAERSRVFVFYKSDSGVTGRVAEEGELLYPGASEGQPRDDGRPHRLADPHGNIWIKSITLADGVTFRFDDEERAEENLSTPKFDTELVIPRVDSDSAARLDGLSIPQSSRGATWRPEQTTQIGADTFQIGSQDATDLGENYAHYLANEVRHRRHRDPQTGKFDGIEIQSVTPGSIASRHGASEGDVIRSINGHPVTSVSEAITFAKNHEDEYSVWEVVISNRGVDRTVTYYSPSDG